MFKLFGIIAFVAVIGFVTACSNGGGGGGGSPTTSGPTSATYVSYDEFETKYELVITNSATGRAAYNPKNGDRYTLTITPVNGTVRISTGTVEINTDNASIILIHSGSGTKVTVTVSSSGEDTNFITSFSIEIPVDAGEPVQPPDLSYTPNESGDGYILINGTNIVTKGNGVAVIPDTFNGKPVTAIGPGAFSNNKYLKSVTIPASVIEIDGRAYEGGVFSDCTNLTTVTFAPNSQLKAIGVGTFAECTSLTNIEIPASVTYIGNHAFAICESLTAITIPAGVTSLGIVRDDYIGIDDGNGWGAQFEGWTSSQTINVQGYASEEAAAAWGWAWLDTDAVRKYWNGSSYQ